MMLFLRYRSLIKTLLIYLKDKFFLQKGAAILMYHSVSDNPEFFTVTLESFKSQMNYLFMNGYSVVPLSTLVDKLKQNLVIPKKTVVLTFDDGYEDNYTNAFPMLQKYNFPATIFLATGRIGNKKYISKKGIKMPVLDWGQIKEMNDSGLIDFQPHTVSHPKLSTLGVDDVRREIFESKNEVENKLSKRCRFFAYPYGDFNDKVARIAKEGFDGVATVGQGFVGLNDHPEALKRNSVDSLTTGLSFKMKI